MQAKSGRVFDGSAHLKNISTNSSGERIFLVLSSLSSHTFIMSFFTHFVFYYIYFYIRAFLSFVKGHRLVAESSVVLYIFNQRTLRF